MRRIFRRVRSFFRQLFCRKKKQCCQAYEHEYSELEEAKFRNAALNKKSEPSISSSVEAFNDGKEIDTTETSEHEEVLVNFQVSDYCEVTNKGKTLYAINHRDGLLRECDKSKCDFEITLDDNYGSGTFVFCGNCQDAIFRYSEIFDNVCDIRGVLSQATGYSIDKPGSVCKKGNDWGVTNKCVITFK